MPGEEVLLMEGCPVCPDDEYEDYEGLETEDFAEPEFDEGGQQMARSCKRWKNVYSPMLGKTVRRCADFSGGGGFGGLGQLTDLIPPDVIATAQTGAIAAAGAIAGDRVTGYLAARLGLSGGARTLLGIGSGVLLGGLILRFTGNRQIATAFTMGPVVLAVYNTLVPMLGGTPAIAALPGSTSGLGLVTTERTPAAVQRMPVAPLSTIPAFAG